MAKVTVTVKSNINIPRQLAKLDNNKFWIASTVELWRLISPYTPFQTGALMRGIKIKPKELRYIVPYAKKNYFENRNFRKDKHPLATNHWDKVAMKTKQPQLVRTMQRLAKKYRIFD